MIRDLIDLLEDKVLEQYVVNLKHAYYNLVSNYIYNSTKNKSLLNNKDNFTKAFGEYIVKEDNKSNYLLLERFNYKLVVELISEGKDKIVSNFRTAISNLRKINLIVDGENLSNLLLYLSNIKMEGLSFDDIVKVEHMIGPSSKEVMEFVLKNKDLDSIGIKNGRLLYCGSEIEGNHVIVHYIVDGVKKDERISFKEEGKWIRVSSLRNIIDPDWKAKITPLLREAFPKKSIDWNQ